MENTDITLSGNTATWQLPLTQGDVMGTYSGNFTFRCYLSPLQQLEAGREFRAQLGNLAASATDTEVNLAFALTQLKHRIISSPPFWTASLQDSPYAGNIADLSIIMLVLSKAMDAEILFKEQITKEREQILNRTIKKGEELLQKGQE